MNKVRDKLGGISPSEYRSIHRWLKTRYGIANRCDNITCPGKALHFHWAKKRGLPYARNVDNFLQLCFDCHEQYDREEKQELVRLVAWVTPEQKGQVKTLSELRSKKCETKITESNIIRSLIDSLKV